MMTNGVAHADRHGAKIKELPASRSRLKLNPAPHAVLLSTISHACLAQSASLGSTIELDPIVIEAVGGMPAASAQQRLDALPGGVALVPRETYSESGNPTVSKALQGLPGVIVQDFFGGNDQPRIQIRGSGLQQNPVERGILMLQDELPLSRADGSYIVGFVNPR